MELQIDGHVMTSWSVDQRSPSRALPLTVDRPGRHTYEIQGEYTFIDQMRVLQHSSATGAGTVLINDGTRLTVLYIGGTEFEIVQAP